MAKILIKTPDPVKKKLQQIADAHAGGNFSALLRYCALKYQFKKDEKIISVKSIPDFF